MFPRVRTIIPAFTAPRNREANKADGPYAHGSRGEIVVDQPMLTVDRQMGLNIVHPEGKVRASESNVVLSFQLWYRCFGSRSSSWMLEVPDNGGETCLAFGLSTNQTF